MVGVFNDFLISPEEICLQKYSGCNSYSSKNGYFILFKSPHLNKSLWYWKPTEKLLELVPDKVFVVKKSKSKGFSSWIKARDYCLNFISEILPELHIDKKVVQVYGSTFRVLSQGRHANLQIYKTKYGVWRFKLVFNQDYSTDQINSIEPSLFSEYGTRRELFEALQGFVSKHLYTLFTNDVLQYAKERAALLNGEDKFYLWWMSFVPVNTDLEKVFQS